MTQRNFEQLNRMAARFRCDTGGSVNRKKLKAVHALTDHASAVKSPKTIFPPMRINNAFSLTHAGYLLKSSLSSRAAKFFIGKLDRCGRYRSLFENFCQTSLFSRPGTSAIVAVDQRLEGSYSSGSRGPEGTMNVNGFMPHMSGHLCRSMNRIFCRLLNNSAINTRLYGSIIQVFVKYLLTSINNNGNISLTFTNALSTDETASIPVL